MSYLIAGVFLSDVSVAFTSPRPLCEHASMMVADSTSFVRFMAEHDTEESTATGVFSQEVQDEAKAALESVGWARPVDDGELTSDDPFVKQIDEGIKADFGFGLDDLLNPAKVVNLERDLYNLRSELASLTGNSDLEVAGLSTADCDGGGGGEEATAVREKIQKKEKDLALERRSKFQGWLKNIFLGQAVLSFALSYVMATNPKSLFGGFDWYYSYNMDISISVLGYWWWWLFVVPSLRSRRPKGQEKKALDIAFLGTPLISIVAPIATKDTGLIWGGTYMFHQRSCVHDLKSFYCSAY